MQFSQILAKFAVSLFTREWIEIYLHDSPYLFADVSLFTREWIEIKQQKDLFPTLQTSPSLRGSGLKSCSLPIWGTLQRVSLFTREWIEIISSVSTLTDHLGLPLYEEVD